MSISLFKQHIRAIPHLDARWWSFAICGALPHPIIVSYAELVALPADEVPCAIACSAGRGLLGAGVWRGVRIASLLDQVQTAPMVQYATVHSADGYSASYSLDRFRSCWLVYGLNGAPLPPEHGYPVRLIAPGCAGYKMPKWALRADLTTAHHPGFWEGRGASLAGEPTPQITVDEARRQRHGSIRLSGMAYGGAADAHITISIDGGASMPTTMDAPRSDGVIGWHFEWTPPYAGDFLAELRWGAPDSLFSAIVRVQEEL